MRRERIRYKSWQDEENGIIPQREYAAAQDDGAFGGLSSGS